MAELKAEELEAILAQHRSLRERVTHLTYVKIPTFAGRVLTCNPVYWVLLTVNYFAVSISCHHVARTYGEPALRALIERSVCLIQNSSPTLQIVGYHIYHVGLFVFQHPVKAVLIVGMISAMVRKCPFHIPYLTPLAHQLTWNKIGSLCYNLILPEWGSNPVYTAIMDIAESLPRKVHAIGSYYLHIATEQQALTKRSDRALLHAAWRYHYQRALNAKVEARGAA
jgi:hypothetical protein